MGGQTIFSKRHPKNPLTSQKKEKNYQHACKHFHILHLFALHKQQNFVFLSAICIFNQLYIIPVLENIAQEKKRVQKDFAFYWWRNTLSGMVHRASPPGPPRRTFQDFVDLFSYFLWPNRSLKLIHIDEVHPAHYPLFPGKDSIECYEIRA